MWNLTIWYISSEKDKKYMTGICTPMAKIGVKNTTDKCFAIYNTHFEIPKVYIKSLIIEFCSFGQNSA